MSLDKSDGEYECFSGHVTTIFLLVCTRENDESPLSHEFTLGYHSWFSKSGVVATRKGWVRPKNNRANLVSKCLGVGQPDKLHIFVGCCQCTFFFFFSNPFRCALGTEPYVAPYL